MFLFVNDLLSCVALLAGQAQFDASELITQREVVSQKVNELLTERAKTFGLLLDDISIVSTSSSVAVQLKCA